jgi:hypothetical protein
LNSDKLVVLEVPEEQIDSGLDFHYRSLHPVLSFEEGTVNVSVEKVQGVGPRYGMEPVIGNLADKITGAQINGSRYLTNLIYGERTSAQQTPNFSVSRDRKKYYGTVSFQISAPKAIDELTEAQNELKSTTVYVHLGAEFNSVYGYNLFNFYAGSSVQNYVSWDVGLLAQGAIWKGGLDAEITTNSFVTASQLQVHRVGNSNTLATQQAQCGTLAQFKTTTPNFIKFANFSVDNGEYPCGIVTFRNDLFTVAGTTTVSGAVGYDYKIPRTLIYKNLPEKNSTINVYVTAVSGGIWKTWKVWNFPNVNLKSSIVGSPVPYTTTDDYRCLDFSLGSLSPTTVSTTAGTFADGTCFYNVQGSPFTMASKYHAICVAAEKPIIGIIKDEELPVTTFASGSANSYVQWADPTSLYIQPRDKTTREGNGAVGASRPLLIETGLGSNKSVSTCWDYFAGFDYGSGTGLSADVGAADGALHFTYGAAGTGIFRTSTSYEFAYSIFDKSTGVESNVGTPAKVRMPAVDNIYMTIYRKPTTGTLSGGCPFSCEQAGIQGNTDATDGSSKNFNALVFKFYYREIGTFEWLPCGELESSSYRFNGELPYVRLGERPIAGLPGPQPGGFRDSSSLPTDQYFDVQNFLGHAFWMSKNNLVYSNKNDVFTYPVLNAVSLSKGSYLGMIPHAYPGQANQDSRLVIFTTEAVYIGRFKGDGFFQDVAVRVSSDTVATFPRPGSDFSLDIWTSSTSYSGRSAVNADGVLYWWGPQGLFRDEGNSLPSKDWSLDIIPFLEKDADPQKADRMHAVYNPRTFEVIWFYVSKAGVQKALAYNRRAESFHIWQFDSLFIDHSQTIQAVYNRSVTTETAGGLRILLSVRDSSTGIQRPMFMDDFVNNGDLRVTRYLMVQTVTSPTATTRRLTFRADTTRSLTLPTTGSVTIPQMSRWTGNGLSCSGIFTIVGSDTSTYIDISTPAALLSLTGDPQTAYDATGTWEFPVFIESTHGFSFNMLTSYYAPSMQSWWRFIHCHHAYDVRDLLPATTQTITLKWRSNQGTDSTDRTSTISDNSRGMCQIFSQIVFTKLNHESQGISIQITTSSGLFNGSRWRLQYLAYHCNPMSGGYLRSFEG